MLVSLLTRASLAVALCLAASAQAAPITSLYSTGLSAAGTPLPAGADDPHYIVLENSSAAAQVVRDVSPYFPNNASSQWIWEAATGLPINVTRTFRTTFDLTGFDAATATISGLWGTDNEGLDILLNGVSQGISLLGVVTGNFTSLHAFTINSGDFVAGVNTLDFVIKDSGGISAFRAQLTGDAVAAPVPEPGSLVLFGLGFAGLAALRRRKR